MTTYDLTISPKALTFIAAFQQQKFPEEDILLVLADTHIVGGGIIPEIRPNSFIFKGETSFYDNLFPKGYKDYPFATYVDRQSQVEHMLPDAFLVDVGPDRDGNPKLVFKNPRFE